GPWEIRQAVSRLRNARPAHRLRGERVQLLRALPERRRHPRRPRTVAPPAQKLAALDRRAGLTSTVSPLRPSFRRCAVGVRLRPSLFLQAPPCPRSTSSPK